MSPEQTAPIPIAQTTNSGAGTGTITFDQPLDTGASPDPAAFVRGFGLSYRAVTAAAFDSPTVVSFDLASSTGGAVATGWHYLPSGSNDLVGSNGLPVAAFAGFTG